VNGRRILVAEASAFSRGLIRGGLEMAGYRVVEAANLEQAIRGLEQQPVDIVVAALDLPPDGCSGLNGEMLRRPEWSNIPILALADSSEPDPTPAGQRVYADCQPKFDREAMLESLLRLAAALTPAETAIAPAEVYVGERA